MQWLEEDLPKAPPRRDELGVISTVNPLSELLASRWDVLGLFHSLQVVLRRSVDRHPHLPLPWLIAEGAPGWELLADTHSLRGSFVRYLLGNLRSEFWGGGRGVEHLVRRVLRAGRCQNPSELRVFVDVGALCHEHECLSKILLAEAAKKCRGGRTGRILVDALEPNARNFRSTQAQLLGLPRRWRRRLRFRRAAAGNTTLQATLYGAGAKASLKAAAYGGLSWSWKRDRVMSSADTHEEQVPVIRLDSWVGARLGEGRIEVLKIDVEGSEWEVLQGAGALLAGGHVLCVVLEYSHFWSQMTLKGLARWMLEKGYDGYLVGSPHLVPVSGAGLEWWHDLYEVCARPDSRIYRGLAGWCWLNVAFVLRGSWLGTLAAQWLPQDREDSCSDTEDEISPWSLWCEEAEQVTLCILCILEFGVAVCRVR
ncbi:unnamed protein product [Symbiodinium natans]|uniref:Methyltransferase FkbM domain-containing protein n=1 Tax=Symbiodinium natans TaxID=878477 RepID=A0A812PRC2_9DINO|nr:unnamed protein product [Symbiodinium natans]